MGGLNLGVAYVNGFTDASYTSWILEGTSPYLADVGGGYPTDYIIASQATTNGGVWLFPSVSGVITGIQCHAATYAAGNSGNKAVLEVYQSDDVTPILSWTMAFAKMSWQWYSGSVTPAQVQNGVCLKASVGSKPSDLYCDAMALIYTSAVQTNVGDGSSWVSQ
jgi:hypothetical protein